MLPNGTLSFNVQYKEELPRPLILSVPKAGTYLLSAILEEVGFVDSKMHLEENFVWDRRDMVDNEPTKVYPFDMFTSVNLVSEGQYGLGHLPFEARTQSCFSSLKKVFVYRNLRDVVVSATRYFPRLKNTALKIPNYPSIEWIKKVEHYENIEDKKIQTRKFLEIYGRDFFYSIYRLVPWSMEQDVFAVSFEELNGDYGMDRQNSIVCNLHEFLTKKTIDIANAQNIIKKCIGSSTVTYSGQRSSTDEYWDEKVEELFEQSGLKKLNICLGYEK